MRRLVSLKKVTRTMQSTLDADVSWFWIMDRMTLSFINTLATIQERPLGTHLRELHRVNLTGILNSLKELQNHKFTTRREFTAHIVQPACRVNEKLKPVIVAWFTQRCTDSKNRAATGTQISWPNQYLHHQCWFVYQARHLLKDQTHTQG